MRPIGPPPPTPDDYPIVPIPIGLIGYRWIDTERWGSTKSQEWLDFYAGWEQNLKTPGWIPTDWKEQLLWNTYRSVCKEARDDPARSGLKNPLNVAAWDGRYAVLRGNTCLCILRVRGYVGKVPCRVALADDTWNDYTASYLAFPYDKDVDYTALQNQFKS